MGPNEGPQQYSHVLRPGGKQQNCAVEAGHQLMGVGGVGLDYGDRMSPHKGFYLFFFFLCVFMLSKRLFVSDMAEF